MKIPVVKPPIYEDKCLRSVVVHIERAASDRYPIKSNSLDTYEFPHGYVWTKRLQTT